jgi:regulator of protease activity HflC (stomatin/prohibitin superfamily)
VAWVVFLAVAVPLLGFLAWLLLNDSFVRIEPGRLGLLLVRGKATDEALLPGPHFVPAFRRRMVQEYPSNELSYRAGEPDVVSDAAHSDLEQGGPALRVMLGDRAILGVGYTVRFRLDPTQLRGVHERFSPDGLWAAVRDQTSRTIRASLSQSEVGIDDLFGPARQSLESDLGAAVGETLAADGFETTLFCLGDLDLGRTGEVIQATVRARHELAREEAEAATRLARVRIDAELEPYLANVASSAALRYREVDVWRELAQTQGERASVAAPGTPRSPSGTGGPPAEPEPPTPAPAEP